MSDPIAPLNETEFRDAILSSRRALVVGRRTKPPLSDVGSSPEDGCQWITTRQLAGITQYEPSEFTFTALAGTPISELQLALGERGQYLPFDPLLADTGATLGGTVAAGLSGPGRFRYGGIRDFFLGVRFLSGDGEWINAGGKVVKNAAGFDIPKFLVGSLGRYAAMLELTFKVFPRPVDSLTLCVECDSHEQARQRMALAANSRWEIDAIDYCPDRKWLQLRLAGPGEAIERIADEIRHAFGSDAKTSADPGPFWRAVQELNFGDRQSVMKVPTSSRKAIQLSESLLDQDGVHVHVSMAGQLVWLAFSKESQRQAIESVLSSLELSGLLIRGRGPSWLGDRESSHMERAIKQAMDPESRFPAWPSSTEPDCQKQSFAAP